MFQSTHPHRVRHACKGSILFPYLCFNPRTHTGCDVSLAAPQFLNRRFQSTHPHGVRHPRLARVFHTTQVSIHAPTRGATRKPKQILLAVLSFNPRTHTGCDPAPISFGVDYLSFNPRTHTGCDNSSCEPSDSSIFVSIHAPTRGATRRKNKSKGYVIVSIHAPTRGATNFGRFFVSKNKFQSTHPHGVRRIFMYFK